MDETNGCKENSKFADNSGLVDLATLDPNLEDIMITDYPGKITEDQHVIDTLDPDAKVYRFLLLDKKTLLAFLRKYLFYEYAILDAENGSPIFINKLVDNHRNHLS